MTRAVWPLTARDDQLARILATLADGRGVIVTGPPGTGRTRLLAEAARRAASSVHEVFPGLSSDEAPFAALALPGTEGGEPAAFAALRDAATATSGPAPVLLVDDAHLLPAACARVIARAMLAGHGVLLASVPSGHVLDRSLSTLVDSGAASVIELPPLTRDETYALVRAVLRGEPSATLLAQSWRWSAGNVAVLHDILATEMSRGRLSDTGGPWHLLGAVDPAVLSERIASLRAGLGEAEADALDWIALTEPVPPTALNGLVRPAALDALGEAALITARPSPGRRDDYLLHVAQPLLGEAIRRSLPPGRRERMHEQVLAGPARQEPFGRIRSLVWAASAGRPVSADEAVAAAELANRMHDHGAATDLATAALSALNPPADDGGALRSRALLARAHAARFDGDREGALDDVDAALAVLGDPLPARRLDEPWLAALATKADVLHYGLARPDEALRLLSDAETDVAASGGTGMASRVAAERMTHLAFAGRFREYLDQFGRVRGVPEPARTRLTATTALATAAEGRPAAAVRQLQRAYLRGVPTRRAWVAEELSAALYTCMMQARGVAGVEAHISAIDVDGVDPFVRFMDGVSTLAVAGVDIMRGDLDRGAATAAAAVTALEEHDPAGLLARAYALAAESAALGGDTDRAASLAGLARAEPLRSSGALRSDLLRSLAFVTACVEGVPAALDEVTTEAERMREQRLAGAEALALQNGVRLGDRASAIRMTELASRLDGTVHRVFVTLAQATLAGDANGMLRASLRFERSGMLVHALEASHRAADTAARAGLAKLRDEASRRFSLLRAALPAARTPVLPPPDDATLELTPRARQIARLVARGATNRDIARQLHLSVRTVEGHLARVYAKLGISGRQELALIRSLSDDA